MSTYDLCECKYHSDSSAGQSISSFVDRRNVPFKKEDPPVAAEIVDPAIRKIGQAIDELIEHLHRKDHVWVEEEEEPYAPYDPLVDCRRCVGN